MLGLLINSQEKEELLYLLKREMEELLFDFEDERIDSRIKHSMEERYGIIFSLFKRIASGEECIKYMRKNKKGGTGSR